VKVKYNTGRSTTWSLLAWLDIPSKVNPDDVYLRRLRIFNTPWVSLYLHWIYEEDLDRFPHDHPWGFWSFIIRGGYTEETYDRVGGTPVLRSWRRWSMHHMPLGKAHKIVRVSEPLMTLVLTGRRAQVWSFWTPQGKVPYADYLAAGSE
jgi:hypothetical protein